MKLTVNGKELDFADGLTASELLAGQDVKKKYLRWYQSNLMDGF